MTKAEHSRIHQQVERDNKKKIFKSGSMFSWGDCMKRKKKGNKCNYEKFN